MKTLTLAVLLAALPSLAHAGDALDALKPFSASTLPAPAVRAAPRGPSSSQPLAKFAKVSDDLYRSAQPTQQGVQQLASAGIKTILKLNFDDPAESDWAAAAGIDLVPQLMDNHSAPTYDQIDAALAFIAAPTTKKPVDVHCHHGQDRTGAVVAAYRVKVQGWTVAQAAAEAKQFGYGSPGFQDITAWLNGYIAR